MRVPTLPVVALIVASTVLAACGGGDGGDAAEDDGGDEPAGAASGSADATPAEDLIPVRVALDFVPNTNHAGVYIADSEGWYAEEGLDVEILPYGATFPDVLVSSGEAEIGFSYQAGVAYSRAAGSDVVQVFAPFAKTQYAISVQADRDDLTRPRDLDGKIYAGFGTPDEGPALQYVIRADGGTGEFETVALDTAAYEAMYAGRADFTYSVKTWDGVQAELIDQPVRYFEFSEYGFPEHYSLALIASDAWLADNGDVARAFLAATQRGYEFAEEDPEAAADLLIEAAPDAFQDPELVRRSAQLLVDDDYYRAGGDAPLGAVDESIWEGYGSFLFDNGLLTGSDGQPLAEEPDWSEYFTNDYLPTS